MIQIQNTSISQTIDKWNAEYGFCVFGDTLLLLLCRSMQARLIPRCKWRQAESGLMCRLKDHFITTPLFWLIAFLLAGFCGRICFCLEHALMKGMSVRLTSFSLSTKAPFLGVHLTWVYSTFEEKGILSVASLLCCKKSALKHLTSYIYLLVKA